jgi:hypothetical protein
MADTLTIRPNDQDRKTMSKIRKHLVEIFAETGREPTETDIVRFAFLSAEKELSRKLKQK